MNRSLGTHITPLTQNIIIDPIPLSTIIAASSSSSSSSGISIGTEAARPLPPFPEVELPDPLQGLRDEIRANFLQTVNDVKDVIVEYLKNSITL